MKYEWAFAYLRQILESLTGQSITPDHDGDFPIHYHGADFYARITGSANDPSVQVFSVVLAEIPFSEEIAVLLNTVNSQTRFARIFYVQGQILVEADIWAEDLSPSNFEFACRVVAKASDHLGSIIYEKVNGEKRFEESKTSSYRIGFA